VQETPEELPTFGADREADLNHTLSNQGGTGPAALPPRTDLPPIAKQIPEKPPADFPKFDLEKPDATDFQLQQALVLAKAMVAQKSASAD
jgi:carboxyl-terminal processing protease